MPDDLGSEDSRGGAEDGFDFAGVVFDEDFVRSAAVHEPTAEERMLAAVEASLMERRGLPDELRHGSGDGFIPYWSPGGGAYAGWQAGRRAGAAGRHLAPHLRWQRPVAWALALLMGVGVVLLAALAVYRGVSAGGSSDRVPGHSASQGSTAPDRDTLPAPAG